MDILVKLKEWWNRPSTDEIYQSLYDAIWSPNRHHDIVNMSKWFLEDILETKEYKRLCHSERMMLLSCVQLQLYKAQLDNYSTFCTDLTKILKSN